MNEYGASCMIGTWGWGNGANGGRMIFGKSTPRETLKEAFDAALSCELTLFDTAPVYGAGTAEETLGEFIRGHENIRISTKYFPVKTEKENAIKESVSESLKRLGIESADILWLHEPVNIESNMSKAVELLREGKVKNVGVSNHSLEEIKCAEKVLGSAGYPLFGVQNHYSLIYRASEETGVLEHCREINARFFAYMVLEQGALTGVTKFKGLSYRSLAFTRSRLKKLRPLIAVMESLGKKYTASPAQIAIAHAMCKGTVPIVGVTKAYQATELSHTAAIKLTDDEMELLETTARSTGVTVKAMWEKALKKQ